MSVQLAMAQTQRALIGVDALRRLVPELKLESFAEFHKRRCDEVYYFIRVSILCRNLFLNQFIFRIASLCINRFLLVLLPSQPLKRRRCS
jgi:hypothetical protein